MFNPRFIRSILGLALALLCCQATYSQVGSEHCRLILQGGLYKNLNIVKTGNFFQDLKTYFASSNFKQDLRDGKWGGSIGVVIDSVPISIGANASDSQISTFQQQITNATSLTVAQSFYDQVQMAVPDVELARQYTECLEKTAEFGFKVIPTVNERDVIFIVSYRKQNTVDAMPKVMLFNVKNGSNVSKSFNVGDFLQDSNAITSDRDPEKDLTLTLQTDKGTVVYPVPADPAGFNKDVPVGTIISSFLNWTEFQIITQNNAANPSGPFWSSRFSKWAPADGRPVPTSKFSTAASQVNVPDLRAMFLRGLNSFDPNDEPAPVDPNKKDPDPRNRGSYQVDIFAKHDHGGGNHSHETGIWNGAATTFGGPVFRFEDNNAQFRKPVKDSGTIIKPEGGAETRPKNVAIFYYIRIN